MVMGVDCLEVITLTGTFYVGLDKFKMGYSMFMLRMRFGGMLGDLTWLFILF